MRVFVYISILTTYIHHVLLKDEKVCEKNDDYLIQRVHTSDIVLAAYTRAVFLPKAEFLIFSTIKGEKQITQLFNRKKPSALESSLNRRLINVTGFVDQKTEKCTANIKKGETFLLFLEVQSNSLSIRSPGDAIPYSRHKEDIIRKALTAANTEAWEDWSSCSRSCEGGTQRRKRICTKECSLSEGQQRSCNTFSCDGLVDVLDSVGLRRTLMHPPDRPSAYRLLAKQSWKWENLKPHDLPFMFPKWFSLLFSIRSGNSSFSTGYLLRIVEAKDLILVGLRIGTETVTLTLSDDARVEFELKHALRDNQWHWLSFAVRRSKITFFVDCKPSGTQSLTGEIKPLHPDKLYPKGMVVGAIDSRDKEAFQGDVEQLVIADSPSAAAEQCSPAVEPMGTASDSNSLGKKPERKLHKPESKVSNKRFLDEIDDDDDDSDDDDDGDNEEDYLAFGQEGSGFQDDEDDIDFVKKDRDTKKGIPLLSDYESEYGDESKGEDEEDDLVYDDSDTKDLDQETEGSGSTPAPFHWSEWSPCSRTCDWGTRTRTAYCPHNVVDAPACSGKYETESCFLKICPTTPLYQPEITSTTSTPATSKTTTAVVFVKPAKAIAVFYMKPAAKKTWPPTAICKPDCQNGGICISRDNRNKCLCKGGYFGASCAKALCKPVCRNGGICVSPNKCRCKNEYKGITCETALCKPLCQNGGICISPNKCRCKSGYTGKSCEQAICEPSCQNNGLCDAPGKCKCPKGFKGKVCENAVCHTGCENRGVYDRSGKCVCLPGYRGICCEIRECHFVAYRKPYKMSFKKKIVETKKIPCGAWGWKQCTKEKVQYIPVFKTFYRTTYQCESFTEDKNAVERNTI